MPRDTVRVLIVLLIACAAPSLYAQDDGPGPPTADKLLHLLVSLQSAPDRLADYTFQISHRDQTFIDGKLSTDRRYTAEQISLGGLPYIRRLTEDGQPLTGRALEQENAMYAEALKQRTGLTDDTRERMLHQKRFTTQTIPFDSLETAFQRRLDGTEIVDGRRCLILDLSPVDPHAPAGLNRHIRASFDAANLQLLHTSVEYLADVPGFSRGTFIETRMAYVQGVPLPASTFIDSASFYRGAATLFRRVAVHVISTETFTSYRRFRTTVTLHPGSAVSLPQVEHQRSSPQP